MGNLPTIARRAWWAESPTLRVLFLQIGVLRLGQRVAYAETLGLGVAEAGSAPARAEVAALAEELAARLG